MRYFQLLVILCVSLKLTCASAETFEEYIEAVRAKALDRGINLEKSSEILSVVEYLPRVIELDQSQPSSVMSFAEYKNKILPKSRIDDAIFFYNENKNLLEEIGQKFGVQPRFIVALWALESNFGRGMGGYNVLSSLATLGYEGRRREFFTDELLNAIEIANSGVTEPSKMYGSWAGAMGQTQFMPSSYLEYAVDYDNDGLKDIWGSKADVFASIANYLSNHGWDSESTWGRRVVVPNNISSEYYAKEVIKPLSEWNHLGLRTYDDGANLPHHNKIEASLVAPDDNDRSENYLVYSNYKVIMKWNRSNYFATTVGLLSDAIGESL